MQRQTPGILMESQDTGRDVTNWQEDPADGSSTATCRRKLTRASYFSTWVSMMIFHRVIYIYLSGSYSLIIYSKEVIGKLIGKFAKPERYL